MCTQSLDGITTSSNHEYYSPQIILHTLLVDVQMYGYHELEYFSLVLGDYWYLHFMLRHTCSQAPSRTPHLGCTTSFNYRDLNGNQSSGHMYSIGMYLRLSLKNASHRGLP